MLERPSFNGYSSTLPKTNLSKQVSVCLQITPKGVGSILQTFFMVN